MIAVVNKDCQMSNRLILNAHCLASGICSNQNVVMFTFSDMAENYNCTIDCIKVSILHDIDLLGKVYRKARQINHVYCDDKIERYVKYLLPKQLDSIYGNPSRKHIIHNWYYRDYDALFKSQEKIRAFFQPKAELIQNVKVKHQEMKSIHDVIIGVHIRLGDYKEWLGGRFYYEIDTYIKKIKEVYTSLTMYQNPLFVLFSNESIHIEKEKCECNYFVSHYSAIEDQYLMSLCDYIMGPPSTFSWWAAFMGKKPYLVLDRINSPASIEKFDNKNKKETNKATLMDLYDYSATK